MPACHPTPDQINALAASVRAFLQTLSDAELDDFLTSVEDEQDTFGPEFHPSFWLIHRREAIREVLRREHAL